MILLILKMGGHRLNCFVYFDCLFVFRGGQIHYSQR